MGLHRSFKPPLFLMESNVGELERIARQWFEEVWNQRSEDAIFRLSAENARGYMESGVRFYAIEAFKEFRDNVVAAMPDLRMEIEDTIEQSPDVVVRWFLTGTHTGTGFGFPPTHSRISMRGMTWLRVNEDNLIYEGWDCWNQTRMMQVFVGANPPPFGE